MQYYLLGLLGVVLIVAFWWIATRNSFVALRNKLEEAFAGMDVFLKKRYDLIPNLVETVKGYTQHEQNTLTKVIEARNSAITAAPSDKAAAENQLGGALKSLFALAESYPQLKADTQFLNLQNQLLLVETDIAQTRKYYNAVVKQFNTGIELFPASIVANSMKLEKSPYFQLDDEAERKNVKVQF